MPLLKRKRRYKKPDFPLGQFMLVEGEDIEEGPFMADDFVLSPEYGYWYMVTDGRPIYLRVLKQKGDRLSLIDGEGEQYELRVVPYTPPYVREGL